MLADGAGNIIKTYTYDEFGVEANKDEADTNPFRYAGEYYDGETDSIYLRARYYAPRTGRFTTEDPIRDGLNWYSYCYNNPVMLADPMGLGPGDLIINGITIENTSEYEMGVSGSVRDFTTAYGGYIFNSGNHYTVNISGVSFTLDNSIENGGYGEAVAMTWSGEEVGVVRYTKVDDGTGTHTSKLLINLQDGVDVASKAGFNTSLAYDLGTRGGTYYSNNYFNYFTYCGIPKDKAQDAYDKSLRLAALEALGTDGNFGSAIGAILGKTLQNRNFENLLSGSEPFMNLATYTNFVTDTADKTVTETGRILAIPGIRVGVFRYGIYDS